MTVPCGEGGDKGPATKTTRHPKEPQSLAKSLQHLAMNWRIMHTIHLVEMYEQMTSIGALTSVRLLEKVAPYCVWVL